MKFSEKIVELRKEKGFTQKTFADRIGTTDKVVWTYESGRCEPSLDMLKQIAAVLGVSVGYLVGSEDEFGYSVPAEFSDDEKKLLTFYRGIDKTQQRAILRTAESLYSESKDNSKIVS